ncbi:MAG: RNA 2',3'-cyclic phosphodiesterase [Planctomycetota bacterium]|nr:RNA 2',3'-cyclic phosphodiesterase [Planctomycetota bacterium]
MKRLFLAIALDEDLGRRLARVAPGFEDECGPLAVHDEDDLHLTLSFLGEVDEGDVPGVIRSAAEEFRGLFAPELQLTGELEMLPLGSMQPRALTAVVSEVVDGAGRLHALRNRAQQVALSRRCAAYRGDRRREFRPHVTLARLTEAPPQPHGELDSGLVRTWTGAEVALYESIADRADGGRRYRQLESWGLAIAPH